MAAAARGDSANEERVVQAEQLFASLIHQPDPRRGNGAVQPPNELQERSPDSQELLELLQDLMAANERTTKMVERLRVDLDATIANVKLLHSGTNKALRTTNSRVTALEGVLPPEP